MAGIYIHIPFCSQACSYCNFHFSTSLANKNLFLAALNKEISLRASYLSNEPVSTIYFGGGTPSLLKASEIDQVINELAKFHTIESKAEITLEANPEDLNKKSYLSDLRASMVNRLSIGAQSFNDEDLKYMNRVHSAAEAVSALTKSLDAGFENISVDLLYGTPSMSDNDWKKNIEVVIDLNIPHVSAYCLTVEPKTALSHNIKKGVAENIDDEKSNVQFKIVSEMLGNHEYVNYEIASFCKDGFMAEHNSNYWRGKNYLGLGPSAHSFNQHSRGWNVANNNQYIAKLNNGVLPNTEEELSQADKYNDYVMVSIRTMWGVNLDHIHQRYGAQFSDHCKKEALPYVSSDMILNSNDVYTLTEKGKLFADQIASDLFIVE